VRGRSWLTVRSPSPPPPPSRERTLGGGESRARGGGRNGVDAAAYGQSSQTVHALCGRARGRGAVRAGAPGELGGERMDLGI
jgi:hypothetical protein